MAALWEGSGYVVSGWEGKLRAVEGPVFQVPRGEGKCKKPATKVKERLLAAQIGGMKTGGCVCSLPRGRVATVTEGRVRVWDTSSGANKIYYPPTTKVPRDAFGAVHKNHVRASCRSWSRTPRAAPRMRRWCVASSMADWQPARKLAPSKFGFDDLTTFYCLGRTVDCLGLITALQFCFRVTFVGSRKADD